MGFGLLYQHTNMSYQETREEVRDRNTKALQELLAAIKKFNDDYDTDGGMLFVSTIEDLRNLDTYWQLKAINRQRTLNKIVKALAWHFSYHQACMAVANMARLHAIEYDNPAHSPDTKQIWWQRYLDMVDHSSLRESRDRWHQRYLKAKAAIQRRATPKRWMVF